MVFNMIVKCYAVLDAKIKDFHLAIFDIEHDGAIRQFSDAVNDKNTRWGKHPEDYSLWYVGQFDSRKPEIVPEVPENLVNALAVLAMSKPGDPQLNLFNGNDEKAEKIVS